MPPRGIADVLAKLHFLTPRQKSDAIVPDASRKTLNKTIGNVGEEAATRHLQKLGYRILARNFRCPAGEIDIIAELKGTLAFVEVKARSPRALLPPSDAVDDDKQRRIRNSASYYMAGFRQPSPHTFDIVSIHLDDCDKVCGVALRTDAFR
jgi:putative endonuclease